MGMESPPNRLRADDSCRRKTHSRVVSIGSLAAWQGFFAAPSAVEAGKTF
jgi:hypothetical protein